MTSTFSQTPNAGAPARLLVSPDHRYLMREGRTDFDVGSRYKPDILSRTEKAIKDIKKAIEEKEKGGDAKTATP